MPTLFKKKETWYLRFSVDGRHTSRAIGRVSEELARKALAELAAGNIPRGKSKNSSCELNHRELYELRRKSLERARERGIEHRLSFEDFLKLYERSGGRCEVTGIRFDRRKPKDCVRRPWYPSIDRIDSSGPYSPDNCRVVCVAVNIAMCEWGMDTLKRIARAMVLGPLSAEIPATVTQLNPEAP